MGLSPRRIRVKVSLLRESVGPRVQGGRHSSRESVARCRRFGPGALVASVPVVEMEGQAVLSTTCPPVGGYVRRRRFAGRRARNFGDADRLRARFGVAAGRSVEKGQALHRVRLPVFGSRMPIATPVVM